jgi:hypothetical protein
MTHEPIETTTRRGPSNARIAWWRFKSYFTSILFYWSHTEQRFIFMRRAVLGRYKTVSELESESLYTHGKYPRYSRPILMWRRYVMMLWRSLIIKDREQREGYGQAYMMLFDGVDERTVADSVGSFMARSAFEQGWFDACGDWDATPFPF